ncbi:MAG: delta 5 fatty acid desaturase [Parcubacteria group bacterium LiPW_15]|nr:MAG: delta 5 fatty acid desaturase [Parcubacteria group bacterium LiPW_15]
MTKKYILIGAFVLVAVILGINFLSGPEIPSVPADKPADNSLSAIQGTSDSAKTFTLVDVAAHATVTGCYSVIGGNVYDLTSWISKHPGGDRAILGICGKDGTSAFTKQHGGQEKPEAALKYFLIGTLAK